MAGNFDGSSDFLHIGSPTAQLSGWPVTMACWVRADSGSLSAFRTVFFLRDEGSASDDSFGIQTTSSAEARVAMLDSGGLTTVAGATLSADTWTHLCGVFTSSALGIYVDGSVTSDAHGKSFPAVNDPIVGARLTGAGASSQFWDGDVAEVAIWNVQLSQAEIDALAAGVSPLMIRPASLVNYWQLLNSAINRMDAAYDLANGSGSSVTYTAHPPGIVYPASGWADLDPQVFTGTGAGSFPLITGTGAGNQIFSGSGAGSFPLITGTGAGGQIFSGSGAGVFPLITGTGSGGSVTVVSGSGAGVFPLIRGSGTGYVPTALATASLASGSMEFAVVSAANAARAPKINRAKKLLNRNLSAIRSETTEDGLRRVVAVLEDVLRVIDDVRETSMRPDRIDRDGLAAHGAYCALLDGQYLRVLSPGTDDVIAMPHGLGRKPVGAIWVVTPEDPIEVIMKGDPTEDVPPADRNTVYFRFPDATALNSLGICILY